MNSSTKYSGTILEKNVEATVNGVSYPNVIKAKLKQVMTIKDPESGETETVVVDEEDWYAEGVGPIKRTVVSGADMAEAVLVDYVVKK